MSILKRIKTRVIDAKFYHSIAFGNSLLFSVIFSMFILLYMSIRANRQDVLKDLSENSQKFILYKEKTYPILNSTEARRLITEYNQEEKISNIETFGPIKNNTVVLVVTVNKLHESLKYLIASLSELDAIEETLLVFSHLTYDQELYDFIQTIDFCRFWQIFYPYTLQVYTDAFPGFSKNDCPTNMKHKKAEALKCIGAQTPDVHGKYRQPSKAQEKHYWWWTANRVFEHLLSFNNQNGVVVFLEDDVFVLQDFLYMTVYMHKLTLSLPQLEFIYLGLHKWSLENDTYGIDITTWDPKQHSSVLAFDVSVWNSIIQHYDLFCEVDDASWSRSLLYISLNRRDNKRFKVAYTTIPRALKTTLCSFNGFYESCNVEDNVVNALRMQRHLKSNLFPPYLEVYTHIELEDDEFMFFDVLEGEGGWNDPRDKALCSANITENTVKKLLMDMSREFKDAYKSF